MTSQSRLNPSTTIICTEKNFKGDLATPRSCRLFKKRIKKFYNHQSESRDYFYFHIFQNVLQLNSQIFHDMTTHNIVDWNLTKNTKMMI